MENLYSFDEEKLQTVRDQKLWMQDAKYFKKVKISPSASIKMMMHGQQGVEKGIKQNGKPIEVMGLLLGRPDTEDPHSLVICDAQALPIEGFETTVVADDENVINYMIELGDALEITRKERFCGWYHTHPFDLDAHGHCFLSSTDMTTQLQWQRSEDPHGNPWLAIVIDPLYSLDKGRPEMMAFRVFPPEHNARANETPDGQIVLEDRRRLELWGSCWNRYYKLEIEYFMSSLSQRTLGVLKNKFLWQNAFCTSDNREEKYCSKVAGKARAITNRLEKAHPARANQSALYTDAAGEMPLVGDVEEEEGERTGGGEGKGAKGGPDKLAARLGEAQCRCLCAHVAKIDLFGRYIAKRNGARASASTPGTSGTSMDQSS
ncbi:hypothetical protein B484DRAFT_444520 [Ochromonadaceae sp. CCMP2298]|nr:hypothetical protein B484DRAFT_444520 [Ochromonadaceae sp. CCMP2298]|mmetsp:Transcript_27227/g.60289  ORF Transcript_27227/g.60289 Transcript_27227/m.60289 type:complete len:376 (-) Transcript_27227:75-1202(-)